jgi:hypothetical protein
MIESWAVAKRTTRLTLPGSEDYLAGDGGCGTVTPSWWCLPENNGSRAPIRSHRTEKLFLVDEHQLVVHVEPTFQQAGSAALTSAMIPCDRKRSLRYRGGDGNLEPLSLRDLLGPKRLQKHSTIARRKPSNRRSPKGDYCFQQLRETGGPSHFVSRCQIQIT